ncbi:MAG: ATP-binding protein [Thermodesulfobacteriota bacterium]
MSTTIFRVQIRYEQDVVYARQRARFIAELLGFDRNDQTRISTAVSEVARNAFQYGGGGEIEFQVEGDNPPQTFLMAVRDHGPGISNLEAILEGRFASPTGLGMGLIGSRRLMDRFNIESRTGQGTTVLLGKILPPSAPAVTSQTLAGLSESLARTKPESPLEEFRLQNQELLSAMEQLRQKDEELSRINRELTDINTNMVALYSDLEKKTRQLQENESLLRLRNEELKGFAYTVSHDLKAPLRGIAGYAQELDKKHRSGLSERALFCLTQILTATRNLDRLIEDLLHYSRLDAETPSLTEVNLGGMVESILRDRNLILGEQGFEVTNDIPLVSLRTWERGLLQVLTNLIDNAIKYSRQASPPRLGIRAEESDSVWRIAVQDNGIGFDMKYHDRIFGLFNRLVRMDEFEGTGAGLAIVKKVLDKQGGRIWAESAPGQGATFYVELPKK